MKMLHFSIMILLCIVFSVTLLQNVNATVPLATITILGGTKDHCENICFDPQNVTVSKGTAVVWDNKDLIPHTVVSGNPLDADNGTLFDSGTIWQGQSFIHNFNDIGTFHYFDKSHPTETGTITVTDETNNAYASSTFFYTDKKTYVKGDNILIYGSVGRYDPKAPVAIQILDNKNNSLLVSNTYPKPDASFIARIPTNNTEWKTGGPYDVKVQYGSVYIGDSTFVFYADQLSPLKQVDGGVWFSNITCNSGLVTIMKQEDGTVACIKSSSLQKLISLNWGYDPSEKLTVYGLNSVYKIGQEIDIKFRIHTFGSACSYPQIIVRNLDQKIVWQSSPMIMGCPAGIPDGEFESEGSLGKNTNAPGYPMGLLIINQPGTYSMNISWLDGNVTKEFVVTPQTMPKLTSMDIKVYGSYTPSSLADHFLTGSLYSTAGPIQNGNITITVNGLVMGTTETYLNGCFQFNNWNDSRLADQINKSISLGDSSIELNFQAQYFGDSNHSTANASATSFLSLYAVPLAPAQYDTEVYPDQINVTQGDSTQFHITVKSFSRYWEVEHMKLNLQRTPCGLSYHISPVDNNDSVLVNNTAGFNAVLNTTSYTPSGKYWISIDQDLSGINEPNIGANVGAFYLNVLKK